MPVSKAQQKAQNKWIAKAYDCVNLTLPKGQKEVVQSHAAALGESVNCFIGRAISETMEQNGGMPPDTLAAAQQAAGEGLPDFVARAVAAQAKRDPREQ